MDKAVEVKPEMGLRWRVSLWILHEVAGLMEAVMRGEAGKHPCYRSKSAWYSCREAARHARKAIAVIEHSQVWPGNRQYAAYQTVEALRRDYGAHPDFDDAAWQEALLATYELLRGATGTGVYHAVRTVGRLHSPDSSMREGGGENTPPMDEFLDRLGERFPEWESL